MLLSVREYYRVVKCCCVLNVCVHPLCVRRRWLSAGHAPESALIRTHRRSPRRRHRRTHKTWQNARSHVQQHTRAKRHVDPINRYAVHVRVALFQSMCVCVGAQHTVRAAHLCVFGARECAQKGDFLPVVGASERTRAHALFILGALCVGAHAKKPNNKKEKKRNKRARAFSHWHYVRARGRHTENWVVWYTSAQLASVGQTRAIWTSSCGGKYSTRPRICGLWRVTSMCCVYVRCLGGVEDDGTTLSVNVLRDIESSKAKTS